MADPKDIAHAVNIARILIERQRGGSWQQHGRVGHRVPGVVGADMIDRCTVKAIEAIDGDMKELHAPVVRELARRYS